jgi:hypothetical protein
MNATQPLLCYFPTWTLYLDEQHVHFVLIIFQEQLNKSLEHENIESKLHNSIFFFFPFDRWNGFKLIELMIKVRNRYFGNS